MKDSALLSAYRLASAGIGLTGPLYLYWRGKLGRDDYSRRHERLGRPYLARPDGRLALLHAASAAQALAMPPLVEKLGQLGFTVLLAIGDASSGPFRAPRLPPSRSLPRRDRLYRRPMPDASRSVQEAAPRRIDRPARERNHI